MEKKNNGREKAMIKKRRIFSRENIELLKKAGFKNSQIVVLLGILHNELYPEAAIEMDDLSKRVSHHRAKEAADMVCDMLHGWKDREKLKGEEDD